MNDAPENPPRFEVRVTATDHMAWLRTRLALERTMMAWLRTSVALIGFGFAIVEFFHRVRQMPDTETGYFPNAPDYLGLALIACGVLALVVALWQYRCARRYLWGEPFTPLAGMTKEGLPTPLVTVALLLIVVGAFAFAAVIFRHV